MVELRQWVHQTLVSDMNLNAIVGGRVLQGQSLTTTPPVKPFLVHRFGNDTDENLAEVDVYAHRQFLSVWIHDDPGDYSRIDSLIPLIKAAFRASARPTHVMGLRFLEASADFYDPTLVTIFRYARFQIVLSA